jgi:hypothetical protein
MLKSPVLMVVKKGAFEKYRARRVEDGANDSQFKVAELTGDPAFCKNFIVEEEIKME